MWGSRSEAPTNIWVEITNPDLPFSAGMAAKVSPVKCDERGLMTRGPSSPNPRL